MKSRAAFLILLAVTFNANAAVVCGLSGDPVLDFGTPDPFAGGDIIAEASLSWECTKDSPGQPSFTLCFYVSADSSGQIAARTLESGGATTLPFNVYSDPARTIIIQPTLDGFPVIVDMPNQGPDTVTGTINLYGKLPGPLPPDVKTGLHQTIMASSQLHVVPGTSSNACSNAKGGEDDTYTLTAQVSIPNQCQVTATNLDFGTQSSPLPQTDSQSSITVRCTNNSAFTVGLDEGLNGDRTLTDGTNFIDYELYLDPARSQPWGKDPGSRQSGSGEGTGSAILFQVYGRLPADPGAVPGTYTDTVTVDVEF